VSSLAPDELKKMYDAGLAYNKALLDYCSRYNVLIAMQGYDFAMNSGCILNPQTIRDIYFPFMRLVNAEIEKRGMIPFFHCCGRIWDILPDYITAGYKGYQSVQSSAGMDWKRLKKEYGDDLTIWAGVSCETLVEGSIDDVEREVSEALQYLMPDGGFIFGSTNSVQYGAKTDNYLRALEIVREEGIY
jgi:hypothetical protein